MVLSRRHLSRKCKGPARPTRHQPARLAKTLAAARANKVVSSTKKVVSLGKKSTISSKKDKNSMPLDTVSAKKCFEAIVCRLPASKKRASMRGQDGNKPNKKRKVLIAPAVAPPKVLVSPCVAHPKSPPSVVASTKKRAFILDQDCNKPIKKSKVLIAPPVAPPKSPPSAPARLLPSMEAQSDKSEPGSSVVANLPEPRRSARRRRSPQEKDDLQAIWVRNSKATKDTIAELKKKKDIVQLHGKLENRPFYPEGDIKRTHRCHLRAGWIVLGENSLENIFAKSHKKSKPGRDAKRIFEMASPANGKGFAKDGDKAKLLDTDVPAIKDFLQQLSICKGGFICYAGLHWFGYRDGYILDDGVAYQWISNRNPQTTIQDILKKNGQSCHILS